MNIEELRKELAEQGWKKVEGEERETWEKGKYEISLLEKAMELIIQTKIDLGFWVGEKSIVWQKSAKTFLKNVDDIMDVHIDGIDTPSPQSTLELVGAYNGDEEGEEEVPSDE